MIKLLEHFKRMQDLAARFSDPAPYVDHKGKMHLTSHDPHGRLREHAFTLDMVYMLDSPEQREAQLQAEHTQGDLNLQANLFTDAALMIRMLMGDLRIGGKLVFLDETESGSKRTISAGKLLEALDDCDLMPTMDAYMRACRALHWHTAQLRAHGIEPDAMPPDAPHYPPEDHQFQSVRDRSGGEAAIAISEHAFKAGFVAASELNWETVGAFDNLNQYADEAWSEYDPPEDIKAL